MNYAHVFAHVFVYNSQVSPAVWGQLASFFEEVCPLDYLHYSWLTVTRMSAPLKDFANIETLYCNCISG